MLFRNQKGSAIIEVAIIFPLMLMVTLAFIYFIELARVGVVMEAAANEGAREFAINANVEDAKTKVVKVLQMGHVSFVGDGFYSIEIDGKAVTVKRKVMTIPFFGNMDMKRTAQYYKEKEYRYYNKGIYGPGYTGNPYKN
ncbi:TadE/TadG family type IV pilus assembly protein [Thermanaerosceptrum fracticalcis]|nr:TadE family protein [Thermanaerosceptrum fracticalcis]